jgi:hypothetical protein
MENETAVDTAPEAAESAQPAGTDDHSHDSNQGGESAAQSGPGKSGTDSAPSESERLAELLERQKSDPAVEFTDAELDLLEKYDFGNKQPEDAAEDEDTKDDGQDDDSEKEEDKPQPDDKPKGKVDPDLAAAMKEVGAKSPAELKTKVKELKQALTGKDAQAAAQLRKDVGVLADRVKAEKGVYADLKSGRPEAVAHALAYLEKSYGVKLAIAGQAGAAPARSAAAAPADVDLDLEEVIPKELFVDEASATKANGFMRRLVQELKDVKGKVTDFETEKARIREESAKQSATVGAIDEMVKIASLPGMESIAKIPNLRAALDRWYTGGEDNPAFEPFQKVIDKANEHDVPLDIAWKILRGEGFEIEVAAAENRGRKSAYDQKPSRSLSGMQGKGQDQYQKYSDEQLKEMAEDMQKAPPDWFTDDDKPNPKTIPRRAWKHFFSPEEIAAFK